MIMLVINGNEWLLRYVVATPDMRGKKEGEPPHPPHYSYEDKKLRINYTAFNDPKRQPSCDRKILLRTSEDAKSFPTDGVVKIMALEVEQISGSVLHDEVEGRKHYTVFDPTEKRPAHAQIITEPAFGLKGNPEKNRWKAFQEYLAAAASKHGWVIEPSA